APHPPPATRSARPTARSAHLRRRAPRPARASGDPLRARPTARLRRPSPPTFAAGSAALCRPRPPPPGWGNLIRSALPPPVGSAALEASPALLSPSLRAVAHPRRHDLDRRISLLRPRRR